MHDELRRGITRAGRRAVYRHPEADGFTSLELVVQQTVTRVTGRVNEDDVAVDNESVPGGLAGEPRWAQQCDQDQRRAARKDSHADNVTRGNYTGPGPIRPKHGGAARTWE